MEKSTEQIFKEISDLLGVAVVQKTGEIGKPDQFVFDLGAIVSKIMALAVYVGSPVPMGLPILLNQIHADVEWWKIKRASAEITEAPLENKSESVAEPTPPTEG